MLPNPQFRADLVTFTEEMLYRKLNFLCSDFTDFSGYLFIIRMVKPIVTLFN